MNIIKIILAESSDIMLNGLQQMLVCDPCIEISGKAHRYNTLCKMIEELHHDLVVVGPMMSLRYSNDMKTSLLEKFPGINLVEIGIDDHQAGLMHKIREAAPKTPSLNGKG